MSDGITWIGSPHRQKGRQGFRPEAVVIHIIEGSLGAADSWFQAPESKVSAHYGIGRRGEVHQYVGEADTAFHAGRVWRARWRGLKPHVNPNLYCCTLDTRVLTRDLRWVPAGDLKVGDALVGFQEHSESRKQRRLTDAWVTAAHVKRAPIYRVVLCDGTELRATGEHRWLVRNRHGGTATRWMRTDQMASSLDSYKRVGPLVIPRFFDVRHPRRTYEAEFLSAAFDAEGCIQHNDGSQMFGLALTQRPNALNSAVHRMLADGAFAVRTADSPTGVQTVVSGGRQEAFRFLMECRPPRLLARFEDEYLLSSLPLTPRDDVQVRSVTADGEAEIAAISSSSATYIAEGFAAHNTIGIEHEGRGASEWPDAMYESSARLIADVCTRWSIPIDREHVVGHREIYGRKTCPNDVVDLDRLITMARASALSPERFNFIDQAGRVRTRAGLNVRRGAPTTAAPIARTAAPNELLEFVGWTSNGLSVNGNPHWYRDEAGNYFWAGATTRPIPGIAD